MRVEILDREFYAPIADVVRMAYEMESSQRVWGKPLHTEAKRLPGLVKHKGAWFAPAFALAELVTRKAEGGNFKEAAEQIILGAEIARNERREQLAREREEAKKVKREAEERELEARERESALEVIRKAQMELSKGLVRDEQEDEYQEMVLQQEVEEWDA